ncbi:MAG: zinc-dependent metalloprotease [Saprospiraceae bacterium]
MKNFKLRAPLIALVLFSVCSFLSQPLLGQKRPTDTTSKSDTTAEKSKKEKSPFKPYKDVITEKAQSDEGLFTVHRVDDKWYYEIPNKELGIEMLWISRIRAIPTDFSPYLNAGSKIEEQVVRWERNGNNILVRIASYQNVADENLAIHESVRKNNFEPIWQSFKIEALNQDSSGVIIDVTALFAKGGVNEIPDRIKKDQKVSAADPTRSFIDTIRAFPINVEVIHTVTYKAAADSRSARSGALSIQWNQSMIRLPEKPMMARQYDPRVGWFTIGQTDYGSDALKSDSKRYIRRWRLEPKDPAAYARGELVEPIKPIVYYLDPGTPEKLRPYMKAGVEEWQKVFETAGFKNAIICKDPPTPEEDPEFSPEDARYSVVRYVASTTRNAVGPSVSDPRTGEIIESDIIWYHNHLRSYRNRYLLETGAANPSARTLNTPQEDIGEMMKMVIAHEIGHALGLPHNMKASSAYPVDSLRSGPFTQKYGIATTIMDYARYNYVAQPGDEGIRFVRQIGPYDHYAINWGYRLVPNATTTESELATLDQWIREKVDDPRFQFGSGSGGEDPDSQTECVGDDAVKASSYGLANLKLVAPKLIDWTTKDTKDYADLEELYGELIDVWSRYIGHVVTNIGGVYQNTKKADQAGVVYTPVPAEKQKAAMQFLNEHVFATPDWLLDEEILRRIESNGALERIRSLQTRYLRSVLSTRRLQRMMEATAFAGNRSYQPMEMCASLRRGIWTEIYTNAPIDVYRRNLQRAYLDQLEELLNPPKPSGGASGFSFGPPTTPLSQSDIWPMIKAELKVLDKDLKKALPKANDSMTKYHLEDARDRIAEMLGGED